MPVNELQHELAIRKNMVFLLSYYQYKIRNMKYRPLRQKAVFSIEKLLFLLEFRSNDKMWRIPKVFYGDISWENLKVPYSNINKKINIAHL